MIISDGRLWLTRRALVVGAVLAALVVGCHPRARSYEESLAALRGDSPADRARGLAALETLATGRRDDAVAQLSRAMAAAALLDHLASASLAATVGEKNAADATRSALAGLLGLPAGTPLDRLVENAEKRLGRLGDAKKLLALRGDSWRLRAVADAGGPWSTAAFLFLLREGALAMKAAESAPLHADLVLADHYAVFCPPDDGSAGSALAARALLSDTCLASCPKAQPDPTRRVPLELRRDLALAVCGAESLGLPPDPSPGLSAYLGDETLVVQRHLSDLLRRLDVARASGSETVARAAPALAAMRESLLGLRLSVSYGFVTPELVGGVVPRGDPASVVPVAAHVVIRGDGSTFVGLPPRVGVGEDATLRASVSGSTEAELFPGRALEPGALAEVMADKAVSKLHADGAALLVMSVGTVGGDAFRDVVRMLAKGDVKSIHLACETPFGPFPCAGARLALTREETAGEVSILADGSVRLRLPGAKPFVIGAAGSGTTPGAVAAAVRTHAESVGAEKLAAGLTIRFADTVLFAGVLATAQAVASIVPVLALSTTPPGR